jgi:hypothetical protein
MFKGCVLSKINICNFIVNVKEKLPDKTVDKQKG